MNRTASAVIVVGGLLVALAIVLGTAFLLWPDVSDTGPIPVQSGSAPATDRSSPAPFDGLDATDPSGATTPTASSPEPERTVVVEPDRGPHIGGQVIDLLTRAPVPDFHVEVRRVTPGRGGWGRLARETFHDEAGRFTVPLRKGGFHDLLVFSSRHELRHLRELEVDGTEGLVDLVIEVDPAGQVAGRVVDDATGRPIASARIVLAGEGHEDVLIDRLTISDQISPSARTDAGGRFVLSGLASGPLRIAAVHPDHVAELVTADPSTGEDLEIRLGRGYHIHGTTSDDDGQPVGGVLVQMTSSGGELHRPVLSTSDGSYRLPPSSPGPVYLRARQPPNRSGGSLNFTEETKEVEIVDADLRVDFGPSDQHVTWQGQLLGMKREPVSGANIALNTLRGGVRVPRGLWMHWMEQTDSKGRFVFPKLPCGRYEVSLYLPDNRRLSDWDQVVFPEPGLVEQDLLLAGGTIEGVIVDGTTGAPVDPRGGFVFVIEQGQSRSFSSQLDEESRFVLTGLSSGIWNLTAQAEGYPTKQLHQIDLAEGETRELRVEVLAGGALALKVLGFREDDPRTFRLHMQREGGVRYTYGSFSLESGAVVGFVESAGRPEPAGDDTAIRDWSHTFELTAGSWSASLTFEGLAQVERSFQILVGETTEVIVRREDISTVGNAVRVAGRLHHPDGKPIPGANLIFYAVSVPGIDEDGRFKQTTTGADGSFTVAGFRPGRWSVEARLADGGEPVFPELVVPQNSEDPLALDLVLPAGSVSGTLADRWTGHPFDDEGPLWWVYLRDTATLQTVAELEGGHRGRSFRLVGVPPGRYRLQVKARLHLDFEIPSLEIGPAQSVDVGELALDPCGVLDLEVVDAAGRPVTTYRVLGAGTRPLGSSRAQAPEDGVRRFDWLPLGARTLTVVAEGHDSQDIPVNLQPGRVERMRVILEPSPR